MLIRSALISGLILVCLVNAAQSQSTQTTPATPVYTGIVVDCSGSQRLQMDHVVSIVKQFAEAMHESDEAFLVRYVDPSRTTVIQEFTNKSSDLNDAAEGLYVEGGQTSLFDAVDYSAKYMSKNKPSSDRGLSTLILISSGEDRSGSKSIDDALSAIKEQQVRVFTIGLSDLKVSTRSLDRLSKESGGKAYVPRTTAELSNAVIDILKLIRGVTAGK